MENSKGKLPLVAHSLPRITESFSASRPYPGPFFSSASERTGGMSRSFSVNNFPLSSNYPALRTPFPPDVVMV